MNEELRELRTILNALATHNKLLAWVNGYAVGKNEGGLYVSLFHDRLQYRVCTVYAERFRELPAFVRDNLPEDGDGIEISTDRTVLERKGLLRPCTPFQIARYSVGDDDKAAWRFSGVVRVSKPQAEPAQGKPQEPPPAPPPPSSSRPVLPLSFASREDAIHYGVSRAAYDDYAQAEASYESIKATRKPTSANEMFRQWVEHVEGIVEIGRNFDVPAQTPPASKAMRDRVAQTPGYAG